MCVFVHVHVYVCMGVVIDRHTVWRRVDAVSCASDLRDVLDSCVTASAK